MSEWLKEHAWKACVRETVPWVRIPLSPPNFAPLVWRSEPASRLPHASLTLGATQHESHSLRQTLIVSCCKKKYLHTRRPLKSHIQSHFLDQLQVANFFEAAET
jgi:hypothetical protein